MTGALDRRGMLIGAAAAASVWTSGAASSAGGEGLASRAARRGIAYGAAVDHRQLSDPRFRTALLAEVGMLVPENAMKWRYVEGAEARPRFADADAIAAFARSEGLKLRGHTALWHQAIPRWALDGRAPEDTLALARRYAVQVVSRYRGRIAEWDVVNEAVNPQDGEPEGMRRSALLYGGDAFLADIFTLAADADPDARLFYNDYGVEYHAPDQEARRRAVLGLIERLKRRNAPIHGLGVQAHLKVGNRFDQGVWARFLRDVEQMGLVVSITELDVDDSRLPASETERDVAVADHARRFLDASLASRAVRTVMTWGLSDSHSWLSSPTKRADGLRVRGLPLDDAMRRKPLWTAMAAAIDAAPMRG